MKRTYQPSKIKRVRTHGFRARMATVGGRKVINARRAKGRASLTVQLAAEDSGFPKQFRLGKPSEFKNVFANPVKSSDQYFTVLAVNNRLPHPRLGLAITKKNIKKAVARNRIKRTTRESFRLHRQQLLNIDIVVLARSDAANATLFLLRKSLERHWLRLVDRCGSCL